MANDVATTENDLDVIVRELSEAIGNETMPKQQLMLEMISIGAITKEDEERIQKDGSVTERLALFVGKMAPFLKNLNGIDDEHKGKLRDVFPALKSDEETEALTKAKELIREIRTLVLEETARDRQKTLISAAVNFLGDRQKAPSP